MEAKRSVFQTAILGFKLRERGWGGRRVKGETTYILIREGEGRGSAHWEGKEESGLALREPRDVPVLPASLPLPLPSCTIHDQLMEITHFNPCTLLDKGSGRARLPHSAFSTSCRLLHGPFKLGELAIVHMKHNPGRVLLCSAWPSEQGETFCADDLIHFPIPDGAPIRSLQPFTACDAVVYKFDSWNRVQSGEEHGKAQKDPEPASEICIRFYGDAVRNSHTYTKKMQVKALLESKYVCANGIVSRDTGGGFVIVSARSFSSPSTSTATNSGELETHVQYPLVVTRKTSIQFVPMVETLNSSLSLESRLDNVGGLQRAKEALIEVLCLPLRYKGVMEKIGTTVPRGILLHGPPGVGKTLLVKEAARSLGVPVVSISASDVYNPVLGQSEYLLRQLFEKAESMMVFPSSRSSKPSLRGLLTGLNSGLSSTSTEYSSDMASSSSTSSSQPDSSLSNNRLDRYTIGGHSSGGVIIFIDEIDAICAKRDGDGSGGQMETRIVAQLLTLLEQTRAVVVAATNRPNALDPALRRPGRFDREIEISLPSLNERVEIMSALLKSVFLSESVSKSELCEWVASKTQSWSGADLASLVRESSLHALHSFLHLHPSDVLLEEESRPKARGVTMEDVTFAMTKIRPTSHRGWTVEVPKTKWSDIGGLEEVKTKLKMMVEWPVKHGEAFIRLGLDLPRAVLLHGPPGCAKTTLVRAVANACQASFVCLSGADVYSPLLGEAERMIRDVFKKARSARPSIIFFDEIDAMVCKRGGESDAVSTRVLTQLLTEMDGVESSAGTGDFQNDLVLVMAATNRPDQLDPALLRPGRFDRIIQIPLPDQETREAILKVQTTRIPFTPHEHIQDTLEEVARITNGCSGADLEAICREAAILALKEDIQSQTVDLAYLIRTANAHMMVVVDHNPTTDPAHI